MHEERDTGEGPHRDGASDVEESERGHHGATPNADEEHPGDAATPDERDGAGSPGEQPLGSGTTLGPGPDTNQTKPPAHHEYDDTTPPLAIESTIDPETGDVETTVQNRPLSTRLRERLE